MLTRREMMKLGLLSSPALLGLRTLRPARLLPDHKSDHKPPSPRAVPFQSELPIPPAAPKVQDPSTKQAILKQAVGEAALTRDTFAAAPISPDLEKFLLDQADFYEITMMTGHRQILPTGPTTEFWGYNGSFPGPSIVAMREKPVVARFINQLAVNTVVHYHGGHTTPRSDGYPSDTIKPSGSRVFLYSNSSSRGATLWYHDHTEDFTGRNVYMGLAGFFILTPATAPVPGLMSAVDQDEIDMETHLPQGPIDPGTGIGRFDIPLVIQDRLFDANNQLFFPPFEDDGVLGDTFLVNGVVQPFRNVERRRYRLRFLNGSNARVYQLAFSESPTQALNPLPFMQIGSDGGVMPEAMGRDSFLISMAERMEGVFDFSQVPVGSDVFLVNGLQQTNGRGPDDFTPDQCTPLVKFHVIDKSSEPDSPEIHHLETMMRLRDDPARYIEEVMSPRDAVITREFEFKRGHGEWTVNGELFVRHVVTRDREGRRARPTLGTVEIWTLTNSSGGWVHPVHIHLEQFELVDRNGRPPSPEEAGMKDTYYLGHGDTVRVMAKFLPQPGVWSRTQGNEDNIGQYVFHCHNLEHEDMAMMGSFETAQH